ncbi:hypothetical protein [Sphingobacterium bovistauri]|uniref:Lipocalin-like domain-containing protein n=1 Tax=Sphingobacterium bovistauri TaxID=2781959 RepID=A0ABS7Z5V1_9SPHI|nr:hypothetical protein [Sphingobacterium bovistauri]MCA5004781.1 hypothetical protein [Sphingobacterium bovistauri]
MKKLFGLLLILMTIFSCSKSEIDFNPEEPIFGKWELKTSIDNSFLGDIKEYSFVFDTANLGIRGIRLNGKWGGAIAGWNGNATTNHDYSLSDDKKKIYIHYEGELLDFDIIKLDKTSLIIISNNRSYNDTLEFKRVK